MPERISLQGTAVADSQMLRFLAMAAERDHAEYRLPKSVVERLDPEGQHIVCIRPALLPSAGPVRVTEEGKMFSQLDVTMVTPLPCEILIKLSGQHSASKHMLSIVVKDYMRLEQLEGPAPAIVFYAVEAQRRKKAGLN